MGLPKDKIFEIGHEKCPSCGADVPVRVNKNGNLYAYCKHKLDDGSRCDDRHLYGRTHSKKIIDQYMKQNFEKDIKQDDNKVKDGGQSTEPRQRTNDGHRGQSDTDNRNPFALW